MLKNKKLIALIIGLLILILIVFFGYKLLNKEKDTTSEASIEQTEDLEEEEIEEVPTSLGENVNMRLVSPEGESFEKGQARMWRAELEGIEKEKGFRATCHWEFFLNENNDEVLYQEMDNSSIVSKEDPKLCGFTSTFIEKRGKLRAKLTAEIKNAYGEVIETFTAERSYTVE